MRKQAAAPAGEPGAQFSPAGIATKQREVEGGRPVRVVGGGSAVSWGGRCLRMTSAGEVETQKASAEGVAPVGGKARTEREEGVDATSWMGGNAEAPSVSACPAKGGKARISAGGKVAKEELRVSRHGAGLTVQD